MKKITRLCSFILIAVFLFILSSCGGSKSGVYGELSYTASRNKIVVDVEFDENKHLESGKAVPYLQLYVLNGDDETYKTNKTLEFTNDVYTKSSASFTDLTKDTDYVIYLFVTFNGKDEEIAKIEAKTASSGDTAENATIIKTAEDFEAMANDPEGYYVLNNDIDFDGKTLPAMFTSSSSKQFKGTFDGQGFTISNFNLKSESNVGVFGYTNTAVIKNLNMNNVNADFSSSGKSNSNIGALVGSANKTTIENCKVSDVKIKIKGSTSAELNVGGVIGFGENLSLKNITAEDVSIEYLQARLKVSTGLFAGKLKGNSLNSDNVIVDDCNASGSLIVNCHFTSAVGYVYVGGFVGNLGTASLIKDSYSNADIVVSRSKDSSTNYNYFNLAVGGFMGINNEGSINILSCAAIADITGYAGIKPTDGVSVDYSNSIMCEDSDDIKNNAYFGGFAGKTIDLFAKIENAVYVKKSTGVNVNAASVNKAEREYLYVSELIGTNTDKAEKIVNSFVAAQDSDLSVLSKDIQDIINNYLN